MKNAIFVSASVACGKSTFLKIARENGFKTLSADEISHQILEKNSKEISQILKDFISQNELLKDEKINRAALGNLIFQNKTAKKNLENFMYPKIRAEILCQMQNLDAQNKIFFVEIPLFFESGFYEKFGKVLVIYAPRELSLKRLMERDGLDILQAKARLNSQLDINEKVERADFVIKNTNSLDEFRQNCAKFLENFSEK